MLGSAKRLNTAFVCLHYLTKTTILTIYTQSIVLCKNKTVMTRKVAQFVLVLLRASPQKKFKLDFANYAS